MVNDNFRRGLHGLRGLKAALLHRFNQKIRVIRVIRA